MKRKLLGMGALALVLALPLVGQAEDKPGDRGEGRGSFFDRIDQNKDGLIASDEVGPERQRFFERMIREGDKDGDGKLSREEFRASFADRGRGEEGRPEGNFGGRLSGIAERLKQLDANGDGKVALDEVPEERQDMFEAMLDQFDEDGDDAISLEEMTAAAKVLAERFGQRRGRPEGQPAGAPPAGRPGGERRPGPAGRPGPDGRPGPGGPGVGAGPLLRVLDLDRDGNLSSEEIAAAAESLKTLDRDSDGSVTRRELFAAMEATLADAKPEPRRRPDLAAMVDRAMKADKDNDGKLNADELPPRLKERMDRLDSNDDGFVDRDELNAAFKARAERGGDKAKKPAAKTKKKKKKQPADASSTDA